MKTSNWILTLFVALFMVVSTIAWTIANHYSGNDFYSEENLRLEELVLEPFSVLVVRGNGVLNFKEAEMPKLQFTSYEEIGDWQPQIAVRNDTCFVQQIKDKQFMEELTLEGKSVKSIILEGGINFFLDIFSGDSLNVEANGARFHFKRKYPNQQYLQLIGKNGTDFHLESIDHVHIQLENSRGYLNGQYGIIEGEVGKDSRLNIDNLPDQLRVRKEDNGTVSVYK